MKRPLLDRTRFLRSLWPMRRGSSVRPSSVRRRRRELTQLGVQQLEQKIALTVTPTLVADINQTPQSSWPMNITVMGEYAYFAGVDQVHGQELWRTDGTSEGTTLVKDIYEGPDSSEPYSLTAVGDKLFFSARDSLHGWELWVSDGTPDGTRLVADLATGDDPNAADVGQPASASPNSLTVVGDSLYFLAESRERTFGQSTFRSLWRTDGTEAGTVQVAGGTEEIPSVGAFKVLGDSILFMAPDVAGNGVAIWRTDGSATELVTVVPVQGDGREWALYGSFAVAEGKAFFFAPHSSEYGVQPWVSDGTVDGTFPLQSTAASDSGYRFVPFNGSVFFTVGQQDPETFVTEWTLWKSDGTAEGTELVKGGFISTIGALTVVGDGLVFTANDGIHGEELWRSDGTPDGTQLLKDLNPGSVTDPESGWTYPFSGSPYSNGPLTQIGDDFYFYAGPNYGGSSSATSYGELWKTDGTPDGTVLVDQGVSFFPWYGMAAFNGDVLFAADDGIHGIELWQSDGTANGTALIADIVTGTNDAFNPNSPFPPVAAVLDGAVYFVADDGINGESLWYSDGTAAGTQLVRARLTGFYSSWGKPSQPYAFNGAVYFAAYDLAAGTELWKTDGTSAGTVQVANLAVDFYGYFDYYSSFPRGFTTVGDRLYFIADNSYGSPAIWKTDGTGAGTEPVASLGYDVNRLEAVGERIFFVDSAVGNSLSYYDTSSGEFGVVDLLGPDPASMPSNLVAHDGLLYFVGGSASGTGLQVIPGDLPEGAAAQTLFVGSIGFLGVLNDTVFFAGDAGDELGFQLYTTDGTPEGTVLANVPGLEFRPQVTPLAAVGPRLFFLDRDAEHGFELWTADLNGQSAPTEISLSAAAVAEGEAVGTVVGTFDTADADAGSTFTYELVSGPGSDDNELFAIEDGVLVTAAVFDFATKSSHCIRVRSTDGSGLSVTKAFTIAVTAAAGPGSSFATAIDLSFDASGQAVADGTIASGGFAIYRVEVPRGRFFSATVDGDYDSDSELGLDSIVRIWNADGDQVAVNDNSDSTRDSLAGTYVPQGEGDAVYFIGVSGFPNVSYDPTGGSAVQVQSQGDSSAGIYSLVVSLLGEENAAPTGLWLSNGDILEGPGVFVGDLTADDPDGTFDVFTFALVAGEGDADNDLYQVVQGYSSSPLISSAMGRYAYLETAADFSVDSDTVHSVRIQVLDAAGNAFEQVFSITVTADASGPTVTITDDAAGTATGPVSFTFTFSNPVTGFTADQVVVANGTKGAFTAVSDTVYTLVVAPTPDSSGTLTVAVNPGAGVDGDGNDSLGASVTQAFNTIVDTTPPTLTIADEVTDMALGLVAFTFTFSEPVVGFTADDVSVTGGTKETFTAVSEAVYTLVVTVPTPVQGTVSVAVAEGAAEDLAGNPSEAAEATRDFNSNSLPFFTSASTVKIVERTSLVLSVAAEDIDFSQTLTYSVVGGPDAALFRLVGNDLLLQPPAGPVFASPADAGGDNVYDVTIAVSDGMAVVTQDVRIAVFAADGNLAVAPIGDTAAAALLAQSLVGSGVTISNVSFKGTGSSAGFFTGGLAAGLGVFQGIVLSSGRVAAVIGPNMESGTSNRLELAGDSTLDALIPGFETYDATVLEFDFTVTNSALSFQYVFASEEYNEYVNSSYNDVFGFFVDGVNIALIPGTSTPVSINNVNAGLNSEFYRNNSEDGGAVSRFNTEADGFTSVLQASVTLQPGTHRIKLAIADSGDSVLDSWVFLSASSFVSGAADLSISADPVPPQVAVGDEVTLSYTVTNNGPAAASGVIFQGVLPSSMEFVSATASQGDAVEAGGFVTAGLGELAAGESATLVVKAKVIAAGSISTTGFVQANQVDPSAADNVVTISMTTDDVVGPTVVITDDVPGIATGPVTFTFTFSEPVVGFTAGSVAVTGGTKGAFTEVSDTVYTLVVTPPANPTGPIVVSLAAGAATDPSGNPSAAANASQQVPVKAVLGAATPAGTVTEDAGVNAAGFLVVTGTFTIVDPNPGEAGFKTVVGVPAGVTNLGSLTIDATGGFTYRVKNSLGGVQSLRVGESRTEVFTIESLDGTKLDVAFSITGVADLLSGVVADGYLAGATIYADLNGNRVFDAGEPFTTTDASGNFSFDFGSATATLVSIGGTDVSTGLPFAGSLTAPAGATVINPLTTVVTALVEAAGPAADAEAHAAAVAAASSQVVAALGLPGVSLTAFDPLAAGADDAAALAVQKAAASVANVIVVAITVGIDPAAVVGNIAAAVTTVSFGQTVDLGDPVVVTSMMTVVAGGGSESLAPPAAAVSNVAQVNAQIAAAATINAVTALQTVVQSASAFIDENAPADTIAYQSATPPGMTAPVFSLKDVAGDDKSLVTIDPATGAVRLLAPANFETKSSYRFTVVASEDGQADVETTVTVGVSNVNETPTDIALSTASVAENASVGTAVGTLTTTDPDAGNTFTYTLVSGDGSTDNGSFTIDGSTLKTAASFNFEVKSSYTVRVRSADQGGLFTEKSFTVTVSNVNETPTDIALSAASVAENASVGTAVGTLTTTDPDAGNTFTYTLVSGDGSTDNGSFTIDGSTLKTAASFNFEVKSSYTVRVRSVDQGGLSTEKAFTITVTNVAEPLRAELVRMPDARIYRSGEQLRFTIVVSAPVTVVGKPTIDLVAGAGKKSATYLSGSGTNELVFQYVVGSTVNAASVMLGSAIKLASKKVTIRDAGGTNLPLAIAGGAVPGASIDTAVPTVSSVAAPAKGTFRPGDVMRFSVTFSENVTVRGLPLIQVKLDKKVVANAVYVSGSGSRVLVFEYSVRSLDASAKGPSLGTSIALSGGAITDGAGNPAKLTFKAPSLAGRIVVPNPVSIAAFAGL